MRKTPTATASRIYIDSFSGTAADLPPSKRTPGHVLRALARDPRVSTNPQSNFLPARCPRRGAVAVYVHRSIAAPGEVRRAVCVWRTAQDTHARVAIPQSRAVLS